MNLKWTQQLAAAMRRAIREAQQDGVCGMSRDNLWQATRIPQSGGPQGVNAAWTARQIFNNICEHQLDIRKFTY